MPYSKDSGNFRPYKNEITKTRALSNHNNNAIQQPSRLEIFVILRVNFFFPAFSYSCLSKYSSMRFIDLEKLASNCCMEFYFVNIHVDDASFRIISEFCVWYVTLK